MKKILLFICLVSCSGEFHTNNTPDSDVNYDSDISDSNLNSECIIKSCSSDMCGAIYDDCGGFSNCPIKCDFPNKCGVIKPNFCGCLPEPIEVSCAKQNCDITVNNCNQYVVCDNKSVINCEQCLYYKDYQGCLNDTIPYICSIFPPPIGCTEIKNTIDNLYCCEIF